MDDNFYEQNYRAEDRHWWYLGRREILLSVLDRWFPQIDGDHDARVLDVGSGTGMMLSHLSRYGEAEGVDMHEEAVRFCRERGLQRVQQVGAPPFPFEDERFDLVTALDVIEHADDDAALVQELNRVLRPGGMLLVTVPAYMSLWGGEDVVSHHRRRYLSGELRERLMIAGFDVKRLSYFNTLLFPAVAGVRWFRRLYPTSETAVASDFDLSVPRRLNSLLRRVFATEASLIERMNLPFGVSILAVARKP